MRLYGKSGRDISDGTARHNVAGNRLAEGKSELTGLLGGRIRSEKE